MGRGPGALGRPPLLERVCEVLRGIRGALAPSWDVLLSLIRGTPRALFSHCVMQFYVTLSCESPLPGTLLAVTPLPWQKEGPPLAACVVLIWCFLNFYKALTCIDLNSAFTSIRCRGHGMTFFTDPPWSPYLLSLLGGGGQGLPGASQAASNSAFLRFPDGAPEPITRKVVVRKSWEPRCHERMWERVGALWGFADIGVGVDLASEEDGDPLKDLGARRRAAGRLFAGGVKKITPGAEWSKDAGRWGGPQETDWKALETGWAHLCLKRSRENWCSA